MGLLHLYPDMIGFLELSTVKLIDHQVLTITITMSECMMLSEVADLTQVGQDLDNCCLCLFGSRSVQG